MHAKSNTVDVRQQSLRPGEVAIQHDFTEALTLKHNEEIQSKHFGDSTTVSIEGYTCHYKKPGNEDITFDFHSYYSDEKTQRACTVYFHMNQLAIELMGKEILQEKGRLLGFTDGCCSQYKCANAVYLCLCLK